MSGPWGPDGPPPEAYSRVTEPERFAPLVVFADAMVERLQSTYDVIVTPTVLDRAVRAVRLQPRIGAALTVGVSDFPGLHLAYGVWTSSHLPQCGCDACDESADSTIEEFTELVGDLVGGRFVEQLSLRPRRLGYELSGHSGWSVLSAEEYRELTAIAPPGRRVWPAWPPREA